MAAARFEIIIQRISDQRWHWTIKQSRWIIGSGESAGEAFAFCAAAKAIMSFKKYQDESGILGGVPNIVRNELC